MLLRRWAVWALCMTSASADVAYNATGRWGAAYTVIASTLYVLGGKTDPYNEYSYTSAPTTNDLIALDLSTAWALDAPPWRLLSGADLPGGPQGPAVAWHTFTAYSESDMLVLGGDAGPSLPIATNPDSAWLLSFSHSTGSSPSASTESWSDEPKSWASEPMRLIYQTATAAYGSVWLVGGSKDDGSKIGFNTTWRFDPSTPSFASVGAAGAASLYPMFGHASVLLINGTLVVFGGWSSSLNQLLPMTEIWILDTTLSDPLTQSGWTLITLSSTGAPSPSPRRNFAYALLEDGYRILIHGGADGSLESVYSDGWILDMSKSPPTWTQLSAIISSDGMLGPRFDHYALGIGGGQVLFTFGRGANGPADTGPYIFDAGDGTGSGGGTYISQSYTPVPSNTLGNPPGWPGPTSSWPVTVTTRGTSTGLASKTTVSLETITTGSSVIVISAPSTTAHVSTFTFTSTNSAGSLYTSIASTTLPPTSSSSSTTPASGSGNPANNKKIIGIAVGTVIGSMTLALVAGALVVYASRSRRRRHWALVGAGMDDDDRGAGAAAAGVGSGLVWSAHDDEEFGDPGTMGETRAARPPYGQGTATTGGSYMAGEGEKYLPMAGPSHNEWSNVAASGSTPRRGASKKVGWAVLGLGSALGRSRDRSAPYLVSPASPTSGTARFDMLRDEDEREFLNESAVASTAEFGPYTGRRPGMGSRHGTGMTGTSAASGGSFSSLPWYRRTPSGSVYDGVVSSMRAIGRSISGSQVPQAENADWWEKHPEFLDAQAGLLNDDEIGQHAAALAATAAAAEVVKAEASNAVANDPASVMLVSQAARMRGGRPSETSILPLSYHSQASSYYRDPFADGPEDVLAAANLIPPAAVAYALGRTDSSLRASSSGDHTAVGAEAVELTSFRPTHRTQQSDGAGSSTGPGTAAYDAQAAAAASGTVLGVPRLALPRLHSSSTIASAEPGGGAASEHSHGSNAGSSSGSSTTGTGSSRSGFGRASGSADTQHTLISSAPSGSGGKMQRTNSWWSRFSSARPLRLSNEFGSNETRATSPTQGIGRRLSFRLGGGGNQAENKYVIDFRDPNPPPQLPRLHAIEETGNTPDGSPESAITNKEPTGQASGVASLRQPGSERGNGSNKSSPSAYARAAQSTTSLHTMGTANSDIAEKVARGHYHVQRAGTPSHHEPSTSEAGSMSSSHPSMDEGGAVIPDELGEIAFVTSPTAVNPARNPVLTGPRPPPPIPPSRAQKLNISSNAVAERIAQYERRATLTADGAAGLPGGPRLPAEPASTAAERREQRRRTTPPEEESGPPKVRWSVSQRQPLFITNPDERRRDGSGDTSQPGSTNSR